MKGKFRIFFSIIFFGMLFHQLTAHAQSTDYSVYANIIYRMTKYMEWPESNSKEFEIGVIGDSPLTEKLKSVTHNLSVSGRIIKVNSYTGNENSFPCSILFIPEGESFQLKYLTKNIANNPVLIITEGKGLALKGSCINFAIINDHITLEMNLKNIKAKNIKVSTDLINLCKIVAQ